MVHVRSGKGAKDRYVPLPKRTLDLLREHWVTHRNPIWIFPNTRPPDVISMANATKPMNANGMQRAFKIAVIDSGIQKPATIHTLRHSWSTHLLEEGVNPSTGSGQAFASYRAIWATLHSATQPVTRT
jgi:integrase/recombinase XerD